jgi:hypothetical protein
MSGDPGRQGRFWFGSMILLAGLSPRVQAGDWPRSPQYRTITVPTVRSCPPRPQPAGPLGTFFPTPNVIIRGDGTAGGGYSPLDTSGDSTLSLYGPLSAFRSISAPVRTYTRGYDGRTIATVGTSFSSPNQPLLSPVVYPTQANDYFRPRVMRTPPWWQNGMNWIDQN